MRKIPSSIALRLAIWFLALSFLPFGVVAFFISQNVMHAFEHQAAESQREQARLNMEILSDSHAGENEFMSHLLRGQPKDGEHFIVDTRGVILFHPDDSQIGRRVQDIYSPETVGVILSEPNGGVVDADAGYIVGFSRFRDDDWVDIVAVEVLPLENVIAGLVRASSSQLAASLFFIILAWGLVTWVVLVRPLRRLTRAAREIGRGNMDVEVDTSYMDDELALLGFTLNETQREVRNLIDGLQRQVDELDHAYYSLWKSEERSRLVFDSINDAIVLLSIKSGAILDVNEKFFEISGYQREDLSILSARDLSSGVDGYTFRNLLRFIRRARKGEPQMFEWHARCKDGSYLWVEINARSASLGEGNQHLVVVVRDIDQRKRSQQIQVAMYRIAQIGQAQPSLYEFFSSVHQILQTLFPCPNLAVALYGNSKEDVYYPYRLDERELWLQAQGELDHTLLRAMQRQEGALWVNAGNITDYLEDSPPIEGFEITFQDWIGIPLQTSRRLQGALVLKYYPSSPQPARADLESLSLICVQVAAALERKLAEKALRESEARWQTLMKSSPQLIITVNRAGEILFVNQPLTGLIGDMLPETAFLNFLPGENNEEKWRMLGRVFNQRAAISFEFSIHTPEDTEIWFSANLAPVVDSGRVELAILNAMDITVRKKAEDQVLRLNDQLEQRVRERTSLLEAANQELESFSYSISHDLRAPLRAINGFSRILQDEWTTSEPESRQRYLALIRDNARQMGLLIDDLLAFSRLGRQKLNMQRIPMRETIEQALATLAPEIEGRKIEVIIPEQLPDCAGDPVLIKQVWVNLLSNAFKFTRYKPRARVEVGFEQRNGTVVYQLADNGIGFDMKYVDKLFGVFQRLHRSEEFEGTGVGLAIVHRVVGRHGGRVWAKAEPDKGATFYFSLPTKIKRHVKN
jgi:PAS domain S-box-containing protein